MENAQRNAESGDLRGPRGRVLVVEDDADLRSYLSMSLELAGYNAIETTNGLEALRVLEHDGVDLAIIDLNMPVMSGFRLLRLLKAGQDERQSRMPVIVISGDDPQEARDVVVEAKPDAYLKKPFDPDQLVERVDRLLEAQSA